jgi:2-methylcitrate dehydratase PrpD
VTTRTALIDLAEFAAGVEHDALPEAVKRSVRERMLDTLGVQLAAVGLDTSRMAREVALSWGDSGRATTAGFGDHLPAAGAAFLNGVLAHSLDFDDTHLPSILHPSASILPAVLAVAESLEAGMEDAIAAATAGYEVCVRTGMAAYDRALGNSVFFERGWHATSICGTLGCAVAAARLMGLDAARIGHALGIAASMSSGILEANRAGGSVKRLHCGWAAHAGIVAAQAARAGVTGPPSALEGRFGFYQAFCDGRFDAEELISGLGRTWCVPDIFYKPYPANHFVHAAIDAALRIREHVTGDAIESVELGVPKAPARTIGEPREEKIRPRSGYHAQFSGPFAIAAAFLGGGGLGVDLQDFTDEKARDPRYLGLAARVTVFHDPECDAIFPSQFPARLRVRTREGRMYEEFVAVNRGGPGNPLTRDELLLKFSGNARRALPPADAERLAALILDGRDRPVTEVMAATHTPAQPEAIASPDRAAPVHR